MFIRNILAGCAGLVFAALFALPCRAETVEITHNGQQVDELAGVPALYVTYPSNTGEYCCAGYVMRFYRELFGLSVTDINTVDGPPVFSKAGHTVTLVETDAPRRFDLAQTRERTHVAVVKAPAAGGAVVVEQNYKYFDGGRLVAERGRVAPSDEYVFYRVLIDGQEISAPSTDSETAKKPPLTGEADLIGGSRCGTNGYLRAVSDMVRALRALLLGVHLTSAPLC